ncbi:DUF4286 family protein [Microcella indica]|uniref:DUF4286 family protein n=1 Tax=Microcella indica TaxID=2750620 RepID=UPI0015CF6AB0|nr:DUF4286 family protein [Microcella indica]
MARYLQLVETVPFAGAEAEFNCWYDEVHIPQVLTMPGFLTGQRFRLVGEDPSSVPHYLAAYEIATDDIAETFRTIRDTGPLRTKSPAIDVARSIVRMYEALGPRFTRLGGQEHSAELFPD